VDLPGGGVGVDISLSAYHLHRLFEDVALDIDVSVSALELPQSVGNLSLWDQKLAGMGNHYWASPFVLSCGSLGHHSKACQKLNDETVVGRKSEDESHRNEAKQASFMESVSYRDSEWLEL
jgi:hypothetical protein